MAWHPHGRSPWIKPRSLRCSVRKGVTVCRKRVVWNACRIHLILGSVQAIFYAVARTAIVQECLRFWFARFVVRSTWPIVYPKSGPQGPFFPPWAGVAPGLEEFPVPLDLLPELEPDDEPEDEPPVPELLAELPLLLLVGPPRA